MVIGDLEIIIPTANLILEGGVNEIDFGLLRFCRLTPDFLEEIPEHFIGNNYFSEWVRTGKVNTVVVCSKMRGKHFRFAQEMLALLFCYSIPTYAKYHIRIGSYYDDEILDDIPSARAVELAEVTSDMMYTRPLIINKNIFDKYISPNLNNIRKTVVDILMGKGYIWLFSGLDWLYKTFVFPRYEEILLAFINIYETLLLEKYENKTFNISNRLAALVGSSKEERIYICNIARRAYEIRSEIVHDGGIVVSFDPTYNAILYHSGAYAIRLIKEIIKHQFPSKKVVIARCKNIMEEDDFPKGYCQATDKNIDLTFFDYSV